MPPAPTRPRAQHACDACRISKRKCDNPFPCSHCIKKGTAASCGLPSQYQVNRPRTGLPAPESGQRTAQDRPKRPSASAYPTPQHQDSPPSVEQHPRMLLGPSGVEVYVGSSAALSFLEFLRRTVRQYDGPSTFTDSVERHTMLEADISRLRERFEFVDILDESAKRGCLDSFLQASSGFLHLFSDDDILNLLRAPTFGPGNGPQGDFPAPEPDNDRLVSLYAMIAIGAECRGQDAMDMETARIYFMEAQRLAFRNMLLEPSLSMTINFVLLAFFMFCACRRNTAMLYLGVAARAAAILGLHLPELNRSLPPEQRSIRCRVWKSLRILDLHCNAILGRPTGTAMPLMQDLQIIHGRRADEKKCHGEVALDANFDLCPLIESISHTLTARSSFGLKTAKDYLDLLKGWANRLPSELRGSIGQPSGHGAVDVLHRRRTIGNIHVACGYYFGVLLVSRPFLVARGIPLLHQAHGASSLRSSSANPEGISPAGPGSPELRDMAETCLSAATYLVQMCEDAMSADLMLGNMCILQAWILAAGLVLGFSLLLPPENRHPEGSAAFASAQTVLRRLSRLSPQAQRNWEILASFSEVILSYNNKLRPDHDRAEGLLLERILPRPSVPGSSSTTDADVPIAGDSIDSSQDAGRAWPVDHGVDCPEAFANAFGGQATDEIGFQQFWDDYVSSLVAQGPAAATPDMSWPTEG
ncbi:hypothetical protein ACJZ2D_014669 [Fusarium nematophilum]